MKFIQFTLGIAIFSFVACKDSKQETNSNLKTNVDVLFSHLDTTVHPGDDFFNYANGGWLKKNLIPESESGWGIFNLVADENYAQIKKISEDASAGNGAKGSAQQQIGDFFYSGMDSAGIEKNGISPLQPFLDKIKNAKSKTDIVNIINELQVLGVNPAYSLSMGQDMKNSEKYRVYLSQGGLGLPDRDYYFNKDQRTSNIRNEYAHYIMHVLQMVFKDSAIAKKGSVDIMKLETELAASHKQLAELRDPYANYNKMSTTQLSTIIPSIDWKQTFSAMGIVTDSIIVGQPAFYKKLNSSIQSASMDAWKMYLTWHLVSSFSPYLNHDYELAHFNFYNRTLNGAKQLRPRWKRVLDAQESALGDALGQLFVKEYFPAKTKKRYDDLVEQIVISYGEHIQKLDWMSDSTKQKALVKLKSITRKVGYPEKWRDYSKMEINRDSYCKNVIESHRWLFNYELEKLNKPVDRSEWGMTPQTYNAYYNASNNEIVLPAAIFTAPGYKDEDIDDAVIYGYVGASTIGHELTHGFDDEGRQFDEKGNLKNWWSKEDELKFKAKAQALVAQFNAYTVLDSLHPNGEATLGENIADLGGIVIALDAFKKTKQYKEGKSINGLTPLQRYFLGYAYGWMQTRRPEKLAAQLLTDVHAPIFLRVNGPMSNCDEWYTTFNVSNSHKMYRDSSSRVRIW